MNYVIYDPMVAMKLDLKMKGFTCPIYKLSDVIEHKDEVISPGNSYFCVGESVFKFILKNYHLGRGIRFFSTATMIPKITTIDGIKFTFIRDLKSSKFNDKRDYFLSDAFNKTIRLIPEDKRIITRDLQVGMKYLKEWISGDRSYRFGFGLDYETADVGMGHKKICGVGISSIFDSIYIDFRYPKSQEEWEEFSDVYREFCTKYQDVTWTHHSFFEFSRTDETFGVWCDFQDTTGVNVVEGRNMIHYSLKFTAQLILGVKSWDDSFDLLTDSLGKIQSKYKTLDRFLGDKDAVSEFKSKFIDEDDWNDWVELAKNNPQYWNDKFYLQTYRNLGKYCVLDAYYTLMIAVVEWDKYPERCWKLCLDNLRLGNHLHKTGAILDKDKRDRLKKINEKFLCYSMFKTLSGYYKLKITPLDTTFLNQLSPVCQNIINRGYNPVSPDFWKSLIPSVTDTKDPQALDEYKLARIVGQEMTERVRRYLKNKGRKLSGYTRSKTLRDDFERYRKDLYTESDEKLIKDNKSLIDRARANKNYESKLKILNQSELAQMDFDTTDHYSQYEFAGRKRSFREIYDILRKQWLNVGSNDEFDKIRSTIVNYKGAIPASFAVNSYKKTKYMKILFGDEFDQNPGRFYDEYYKIMNNEEFDKIPDRLTKPRDRKLDPGAVYNNLQNPCHSMWSRWANREEFKPIYQGIKSRANKFLAEWEYDYEVPLQMIRALYIFKAYSKEMQYLEGIFAKKIQKVKWTDPFLRYYIVKDDGDFDDYRIQPKFDICMKITKRSSSGFFHCVGS